MSEQISLEELENTIIVDTKIVADKKVTTLTKQIYDFNVLEVEVGTTGYKGGDTGHGGRSYIRIQDLTSTDIKIRKLGNKYGENKGVEIILGGDAELRTILRAFHFIAETLEISLTQGTLEAIISRP